MTAFVVFIINTLTFIFTILILAHVILSYVMDPYQPARQFVDRLVEPLLAPIRKIVPPLGGLDFSPMILWLLVQLVSRLLLSLAASI